MTVKDLLVHMDGSAGGQQRLEAALMLAETFSAHLSLLWLVAEPFVPAVAGMHIPVELMRQQLAEAEQAADRLMSEASDKASRRGVSFSARRETGTLDRLPALLARQIRHADLAIVGQPDPDSGGIDEALLAEAAFMDTGRPALVIPYIGARAIPPKRAMVAWDGSREAARAVNDALPFLRLAAGVTILVVDAERRPAQLGEQPGADIATHLARHSVKVEVRQVHGGSLATGDVILSQASDEGTDLLVMGGYGHSRFREMVLGGATRHLLDHMTCPVLLSH